MDDETIEAIVDEYTQAESADEWDVDALVAAMEALYATEITVDELREEVG